jgi:hypothetical protein
VGTGVAPLISDVASGVGTWRLTSMVCELPPATVSDAGEGVAMSIPGTRRMLKL